MNCSNIRVDFLCLSLYSSHIDGKLWLTRSLVILIWFDKVSLMRAIILILDCLSTLSGNMIEWPSNLKFSSFWSTLGLVTRL